MNRIIPYLFPCFLVFLPQAANAACDAKIPETFRPFFQKWMTDKPFSVTRTIFPLKTVRYDYGGEEPIPVRSRESKSENESGPSLADDMKANSLQHAIGTVSLKKASVKVFLQGSDRQYEYHFQKRGNCWYLYEFENQSL